MDDAQVVVRDSIGGSADGTAPGLPVLKKRPLGADAADESGAAGV